MWNLPKRTVPDLRLRLRFAALGGLIATAILTCLLFLTASAANEVMQATQHSQERVRVFMQLQIAAGEFQRLSYQNAHETDAGSLYETSVARTRFENLLDEAGNLPLHSAQDAMARERIAEQGAAVIAHFAGSATHVLQVDSKWQSEGLRAALREVGRLARPITRLQTLLQSEIRRGQWQLEEGTRDAQSLISNTMIAALIVLGMAITFQLVVQALLQGRLRPGLRELQKGAQQFGAGNLGYRTGLGGRDELARISQAFDDMADTIAEKQAALHTVQLSLEQSVAERTKELSRANAELSAADERRRNFLANVSHELRTPLTVIRGETQVALRLADRPNFDIHDALARIIEQTSDMARMVDDLFLIARAQSDGLVLDLQRVDLVAITRRMAADFSTLACENGGSITAISHDPVYVIADDERLRRSLAALIENALRHCQAGVNITLEVVESDSTASIIVADDGMGVDPERASHLFDRFRRGESQGEGSGLGLSIVKAISHAHQGDALLQRGENGGTRATIILPSSAAVREAA